MSCNLCKSDEHINILDKNSIRIWTGSSEIEDSFYPCQIIQCTNCGHVYQETSIELSQKLEKIYGSVHAQASTPPGDGNWGLKRAEFFLSKIDYKKHKSAIEVGCADGFLLKFLKGKGYKKLIGIDPSLTNDESVNDIEYLSAFVDGETKLSGKVDLIFSNAVFEHIEDIGSVLKFCKNHLNDKGELFFAVPNAQVELESGDPALFIHEHVHYYTEDAINFLLADNGFETNFITLEGNAIYVSACIRDNNSYRFTPKLYTDYAMMLDIRLEKFESVIGAYKNVLIHGANNKLNNILGWSTRNFSFTLVDNDENKIDQIFFDKKVFSVKDLDFNLYDCLLILPTSFYEEIKSEYISLGYSNEIYKV